MLRRSVFSWLCCVIGVTGSHFLFTDGKSMDDLRMLDDELSDLSDLDVSLDSDCSGEDAEYKPSSEADSSDSDSDQSEMALTEPLEESRRPPVQVMPTAAQVLLTESMPTAAPVEAMPTATPVEAMPTARQGGSTVDAQRPRMRKGNPVLGRKNWKKNKKTREILAGRDKWILPRCELH